MNERRLIAWAELAGLAAGVLMGALLHGVTLAVVLGVAALWIVGLAVRSARREVRP